MITLTVNNMLHMAGAPREIEQDIRKRLTFTNPKYTEAVKQGRWTGNIASDIFGFDLTKEGLIVPRGFTRQMIGMLNGSGVQYELIDQRRALSNVDYTFKGDLKDFQAKAVKDVLGHAFGVLEAPTGSGKTVMALAIIAARKQPALVIVHTKELLSQWVDRIEHFLGIERKEIGIIGGGKVRIGDKITVGIVNSVYPIAHEIKERFGFIVVDECHRCPSRTFTEAVSTFDSRYMLGLSATPWRRDGLTKMIYWYLGDRVHKIERAGLVDSGAILRAEVVWRETSFQSYLDPSTEYSRMLSDLTEDHARNCLIVSDVTKEALESSGICLILSDRKEHVETLARLIEAESIKAHVLHGGLSTTERMAVVNDLNVGKIKVLCATGQLIGEGFDCPALSTLFIATPIKFDGRLLQYLGRILRPAAGKNKAKVYDYIDPIGVLEHAAQARERAYAKVA